MRYFRLATDCLLVEGKHEAALYDIHGSRLFLLDDNAHSLLSRCERNEPIADDDDERVLRFLLMLQDAELGFFDSRPAYVERFLFSQPVDWLGMCIQPPAFHRVDWSLTNRCDHDCELCARSDQTISWQSCQTCLRRDDGSAAQWRPGDVESFVREIAGLGAKMLHLRGGNPLLEWELLDRVAVVAQELALEMVVTTPGTGHPVDEVVQWCMRRNVTLNIVLVAKEVARNLGEGGPPDEGDAWTLLEALREAGVPFYLSALLMGPSYRELVELLEGAQTRFGVVPTLAELHLRDSVGSAFQLTHTDGDVKSLSPWIGAEGFFGRLKRNGCTHGNFEIGSDGKVRTCAGFHRAHADVAQDGLNGALSANSLYENWDRDKGSIEPCRRCGLRYACSDCAVFELEGEGDSQVKRAYCPHDPDSSESRSFEKAWAPKGFVSTLTLDTTIPPSESRSPPRRAGS